MISLCGEDAALNYLDNFRSLYALAVADKGKLLVLSWDV